MCQFYKRLDEKVFRLPEPLEPGSRSVRIDERALDDLLDGIDVERRQKRMTMMTH